MSSRGMSAEARANAKTQNSGLDSLARTKTASGESGLPISSHLSYPSLTHDPSTQGEEEKEVSQEKEANPLCCFQEAELIPSFLPLFSRRFG